MNCIPWLKSKWRRRNFIKIEPEAEPEPEPEPEAEPILVFSEELSKFSIGELSESESESETETETETETVTL
jgi:hypothetical protein